jgi:hypothetical protein
MQCCTASVSEWKQENILPLLSDFVHMRIANGFIWVHQLKLGFWNVCDLYRPPVTGHQPPNTTHPPTTTN